jgi:hypothetical protein
MKIYINLDTGIRIKHLSIEFSFSINDWDMHCFIAREKGLFVLQMGPFLFSITNRRILKEWTLKNPVNLTTTEPT